MATYYITNPAPSSLIRKRLMTGGWLLSDPLHLVAGVCLGIVERLTFRDRKPHGLADGEEVLNALLANLLERFPVKSCEQTALAERIGVLGEPFRLFNVTSTAHDSMVLHEHDIGLLRCLRDVLRNLVRTGRSVRGKRNLPKEDVRLRIDPVRRNLSSEDESFSMFSKE